MKTPIYLLLCGLSLTFLACRAPINPRVNFSGTTYVEGNEPITEVLLGFSLSEATTQAVTINYSTDDGTAKAGLDYVPIMGGALVIPPGETKGDVVLELIGDNYREAVESVQIVINSVENAEVFFDRGVINIADDDYELDIPDEGYSTPKTYPGYNLVWADEFDGTSLDLDNWSYIVGDGCPNVCGFGNNELQIYTNERDNLFLTDDCMVIEAQQVTGGYRSARIRSLGKQEFQYGRIDIRAMMPVGQGIWPALWMMGDDSETTGWPACGEIDIMEYLGHEESTTHGTVHFGEDWTQHRFKGNSYSLPAGTFHEKFHVFTIIWEENLIEWYVDDVFFFRITPADLGGETWRFDHPFYFLVNMAIGGNWPGSPDASTQFPQRMFVDYIRVFQQ
ncbi:MAG: family 16 glycosylhydrolase [Bacteroidota bacterium]